MHNSDRSKSRVSDQVQRKGLLALWEIYKRCENVKKPEFDLVVKVGNNSHVDALKLSTQLSR